MLFKIPRYIYLPILLVLVSFRALAMNEDWEDKTRASSRETTYIDRFHQSPKYLVHIGFLKGLPEDGIMHSGKRDAANYFCINGPLPSNDYMPHLDDAQFIVILKLTDPILKRVVGFHVTEVLVAGEIDLCAEECWIVAPKGAKIPKALREKVVLYKEKSLENRNAETMKSLMGLGAYPISLQQERDYYGKLAWSNTTVSNVNFDEVVVNVNEGGKAEFFSNILENLPGISYSCPAGSYYFDGQNQLKICEIGHLNYLKVSVTNKNKEEVGSHKKQLIEWTNTLTHLDATAREDFINRINSLGEEKEERCIIS